MSAIIKWESSTVPENRIWQSICFAENRMQFVGISGDGYIMASSNGYDWAIQEAPLSSYRAVRYLNWKYVAIGYFCGSISNSGLSWTAIPEHSYYFNDICFDGTQYIAVDHYGKIVTSLDLETWTLRYNHNRSIRAIIYNDIIGMSIAVGVDGTILTSLNGITWTDRSLLDGDFLSISFATNDGRVIIAGHDGYTVHSTNGIVFTPKAIDPNISISGVSYSPDLDVFCLIAGVSSSSRSYTTKDGISFVSQDTGIQNVWTCICWSSIHLRFVALASSGDSRRAIIACPQVQDVSISPLGQFIQSTTVSLYCPTPDAIIRYSLDGGNLFQRYYIPFEVVETTEILVFASKDNYFDSDTTIGEIQIVSSGNQSLILQGSESQKIDLSTWVVSWNPDIRPSFKSIQLSNGFYSGSQDNSFDKYFSDIELALPESEYLAFRNWIKNYGRGQIITNQSVNSELDLFFPNRYSWTSARIAQVKDNGYTYSASLKIHSVLLRLYLIDVVSFPTVQDLDNIIEGLLSRAIWNRSSSSSDILNVWKAGNSSSRLYNDTVESKVVLSYLSRSEANFVVQWLLQKRNSSFSFNNMEHIALSFDLKNEKTYYSMTISVSSKDQF